MGRSAERLFEEAARLTKTTPRATRFLGLLEEALDLPEDERRAFSQRLHDAASARPAEARTVLSWDALRRARGVVAMGGDAVDDCANLYDG